jgi:Sulfotransferase family
LKCSVWRAVRDELRDVDRERMLALDRRLLLTRRLGRAGGDSSSAREYRSGLAELYDAIRRTTGARVLVDTSKAPSYALALGRLDDVELSVVHLVRDPRATAFSRRRTPGPEDTGPVGSALLWGVWNVLSERWFAAGRPYVRVRHEDFVERPRETMEILLAAAGVPEVALPVTRGGHAVLGENHSVAGNTARFRAGAVQIRRDTWEDELPWHHRALVSALTLPLRPRYGYARTRRRAVGGWRPDVEHRPNS